MNPKDLSTPLIRKYISLQEATQLCNYSQEYLSLRTRQGKLKGVKLGRNWVTTEEWLREYFKRVRAYNNNIGKEAVPPDNLPIGEFKEFKVPFWRKNKANLRLAHFISAMINRTNLR